MDPQLVPHEERPWGEDWTPPPASLISARVLLASGDYGKAEREATS